MINKTKQKGSNYVYSTAQRTILILCVAIMVAYIILAYFVTQGSFWTFAGAHVVLAVITVFFTWLGGASKRMANIAMSLGIVGAGTALVILVYYLTILGSLASS